MPKTVMGCAELEDSFMHLCDQKMSARGFVVFLATLATLSTLSTLSTLATLSTLLTLNFIQFRG